MKYILKYEYNILDLVISCISMGLDASITRFDIKLL